MRVGKNIIKWMKVLMEYFFFLFLEYGNFCWLFFLIVCIVIVVDGD